MTKDSPHRHHRNLHLGRRFYGLLIVIAALGIFVIFAVFFTQKISLREKLAASLPADRTIAFLEFNFDPNLSETKELQNLANQNPLAKGALDYLSTLAPYPDQFQAWYSGRGGIALFSTPSGHNMENALFLQVANREKALAWINELILDPQNNALLDEDYQGQKIISFRSGQTFNILLSNDYLILAENLDNLKMLADTIAGQTPDLRNQPAYNKLISALPDQNQLFLYLDRTKLLDALSKSDLFLAGHLAAYKLYFPFLNLIANEAIAVKIDHNSAQKPLLVAQHLALFNSSTLPTPDFFATDYFYSGDLEKFLPPGSLFTAGGVNLLDQKNKLQAYFKNRSTIYDLLFSGMLNNLKDNLQSSGSPLDLDQDLFPLFQKQYLFFVSNEAGAGGTSLASNLPNLGLILESASPESDSLKLEKVLLAIGTKLASQIDAKPIPVVLPDGTPGKILSANLPAPTTQTTNIVGHSAQQIQFSSDVSLYLFSDPANKHLLVSNSADILGQMIAASQAATASQPATPIDYSLSKPTETYHLDLSQLAQIWPVAAALKPLQSITVARKFTEIGLLSTYQIGF